MSNFMNKIKYFIGVQDLDEEEIFEDKELYEEYESAIPSKTRKMNNKVLNIHTNPNMKIVVHEPLSYDEAPGIIDDLKTRKTAIVNLEQLDMAVKKQIFDFLNGGLYAMEGNIQKVTKDVFIFAPNNVEIDGLKNELKNKGIFPW
ncbi:MAG TPA: cell division protein SepF [Tissierellaceae bacterium]|nr:cell division protein SepF [Tissierellaceae bacterium]